ncbi:UPF0728 protein C10orf53 homolog [Bombina bombina]|uniref:UPF0728 protein C10orf53 homolog n=1 Tax=Bombina bombina TaxID=8345 RepID=UPI00235A58EE|nr:UPF0728 protein C10orf53 homolog [Bombina bombina]
MPEQALVTVRYGPYTTGSGLLGHSTYRLQGLLAVLTSDGHQVVLEEILDRNSVQLIVNGENIFQCNIKDLDFGGDGLLDPVCEAARKAVLNAY